MIIYVHMDIDVVYAKRSTIGCPFDDKKTNTLTSCNIQRMFWLRVQR